MAKAKERPAIPAWQSIVAQRAGVDDLLDAKSIDPGLIDPNPYQPRRQIDPAALVELTASIRANGVLQPLTVRERDGRYQLIAGERRWRAAQDAGLAAVPCLVRDVSDEDLEMLALLENIQREDLDPIDEAEAFKRLMERRQLSLRDMATYVHKSHEHVAQRLRLIEKPEIAAMVRAGVAPSVALAIDRAPGPAREQFLRRAAAGDVPSLAEVRATRIAPQASPSSADEVSKLLTPSSTTYKPEPGQPDQEMAPITALDTPQEGAERTGDTRARRSPSAGPGPSEPALTAPDVPLVSGASLQIVRLVSAASGIALTDANGAIPRDQVIAALRQDLARLERPE